MSADEGWEEEVDSRRRLCVNRLGEAEEVVAHTMKIQLKKLHTECSKYLNNAQWKYESEMPSLL